MTLLQSIYGITKENQEAERYYFKHMYRTMFVANLLMDPVISFIITIISLFGGIWFGVLFLNNTETLFFVLAIILYMPGIIIGSIQFKIQKLQKQGERPEKIHKELTDKMLNFYTINPLVISFVDWMKLKLASRKNYKIIRSLKSMQECYRTTFYIANILKKDKIKILWLCYTDFLSGKKCGHAVLAKGNWIYDSNRRRTYPKSRYLEVTQAEIFKELSLKDYLYDNIEELKKEELMTQRSIFEALKEEYNDFKVFCNVRNGIRDTNET